MNADGSGQTRVTERSSVAFNGYPSWGPAPPATKIAFLSDRDGPAAAGDFGQHEIYIMTPDGSDQRRLTHSNGRLQAPAISPDGTRIAFHTGGAERDIYVIPASGGEPVRVTHMAKMGLGAMAAAWSPDGKQLAFHSSFRREDVYVVNLDGTGLTNLTNHPARDMAPTWSPDGRRIAFVSDRDE